ncbi:MAG TPA: hypothetical protein VHJ77_17775 [Vicinamibacterales bacterium]|nr:hypothetical protein [Vicinamibacterales bacterium]
MNPAIPDDGDIVCRLFDAVHLDAHDAAVHAVRVLDHDAVLRARQLERHLVARPVPRYTRIDLQRVGPPVQAEASFDPYAIHPAG